MSSTERKKKEEGASATTPALRDGDEPETKTSSDAATRKEKQQQQVTTVKKGSSSTRKMPRGQLEQRLSQLAEEVQSLRHGQNRILRYLGNLSALPSMQDDLNDIKSSIGALKQMRVHALQDTSASTTRAPAADIGEFTSTMRNEAVEGVEQSEGNVKIWTGTWNVGAKVSGNRSSTVKDFMKIVCVCVCDIMPLICLLLLFSGPFRRSRSRQRSPRYRRSARTVYPQRL